VTDSVFAEPPWYGPVCRVVWEGGAARLLPIPIRPFKAGNGECELFRRRVATVDDQSSLTRRNILLGIGNRGLKATAKVMAALRAGES